MQTQTLLVSLFLLLGFLENLGVSAQTPLLCTTAPERAQALAIANGVANVVDDSLKLGSLAFQDPQKRADFTNVVDQVIPALKNGFGKADICDAIASSIADPLKPALDLIPIAGECVGSIIKNSVTEGCKARQKELGCAP